MIKKNFILTILFLAGNSCTAGYLDGLEIIPGIFGGVLGAVAGAGIGTAVVINQKANNEKNAVETGNVINLLESSNPQSKELLIEYTKETAEQDLDQKTIKGIRVYDNYFSKVENSFEITGRVVNGNFKPQALKYTDSKITTRKENAILAVASTTILGAILTGYGIYRGLQ